jgi:hypothetical protein
MTDDQQQKHHHHADEGDTSSPASEVTDPHHALNTPVDAIDGDDQAVLDQAESLEEADDRAQDERINEERSRKG